MWLVIAAAAMADDAPQYRQIVSADGRRFVGEVLATEADGLKLRTPQGRVVVGFDALLDMTPASAADYAGQPPWRVWLVAPDDLRPSLSASFAAMPMVELLAASDLRSDVAAKLAPCADSACAAEALKNSPFTYVVVAEGERVVVRTNRSDEALLRLRREDANGPALLQVEVPPASTEAATTASEDEPYRLFVRASVVSGYPELAGVSAMFVARAPLAAEVSVAATGVSANPLTFSAMVGAVAPVVDGLDRRGGVDVIVGGLGGFRWFVTPDRGIVFAPELKASGDLTLQLGGHAPALDVNAAIGAYFAGKMYADLRLAVGVAL